MILHTVQAVTIVSQDVLMAEDTSARLGVLLDFSSSLCTTCLVLLVMGWGSRFFVFSS
jgi:hypothetical protein